jgi:hypothetical protein
VQVVDQHIEGVLLGGPVAGQEHAPVEGGHKLLMINC